MSDSNQQALSPREILAIILTGKKVKFVIDDVNTIEVYSNLHKNMIVLKSRDNKLHKELQLDPYEDVIRMVADISEAGKFIVFFKEPPKEQKKYSNYTIE